MWCSSTTSEAHQCRSYACKYCGKPEPHYFLETSTPGGEANPVKRYLLSRNIGLCQCHSRLLGFHTVRSTKPTFYLHPHFVVPDASRIRRSEEHLAAVLGYPDDEYYLNHVQKFFFRHADLRHLRVEQFFRYFNHTSVEESRKKVAVAARTYENTVDDDSDDDVLRVDDRCHRHYDATASALIPGVSLPCSVARRAMPHAHRRRNTDLCVPRSAFLEPIGGARRTEK